MDEQLPLTDARRAELTAELTDKLVERRRLADEIDDIAAILSEDKRRRQQAGTLHPYPPPPPEGAS